MQVTRVVMALIAVTVSLIAQIPDFSPPTPLFGAVLSNNLKEASRLLAAGADPNEGRFLGAPPLLMALLGRNTGMAKLLLSKGADAKATDAAGSTTLMWAAAAEIPDVTFVQDLLNRGVDPNVANKMGETALTWAMRRGYTPVTALLKERGASDRAQIRQSIEKSLGLLQKSGAEFVKVSGCTSCHHQSLPQMAYGLARERGFAVDAAFSDKQAKSVIAMFRPYTDKMMQDQANLPNPSISVTYSLLGLAAEKFPADKTTEAMAHLVASQQNADGSFRVLSGRPPLEFSPFAATALSIRALELYGSNSGDRIAKGVEWLRTAAPQSNEDRAMQLLGLVWGKGRPEDMRATAQKLIAEQRPDGGWAQLPTLESDAYATGQALFALYSAGQVSTSDAVYQKGVYYLLRTQYPDGSWLVRTRSFPFQPLKESGFPHGRDQWISATGTAWATMALTLTVPASSQQVSQTF